MGSSNSGNVATANRNRQATGRTATTEWLVAAMAVACFLNVLPNDFCYDDIPIVEHNRLVNEPGQWTAIWTTDVWSSTPYAGPNRDLLYRPVTMTSYRLVKSVFGEEPLPHLMLNVMLHAMACMLVVRLTRMVGGTNQAALIAGTVFAVLPIHTEVVANVVGRADLLATIGVMVALLCQRSATMAQTRSTTALYSAGTLLAAFVAMGAKESGIAVIPLIVLFDALMGYRQRSSNPLVPTSKSASRSWWSGATMARLGPLLIPLGAYLALRYYALDGTLHQQPPVSKTVNVLVDTPWWQHTLGVVQLWGMYWAKTFWPAVLSVKYSINSIRPATTLLHPHVLLGAAVTVGFIVWSLRAWRRGHRHIATISLALLICYAPTSNTIVLIQVYFAERIWYLPSVWVAVLIGLATAPLLFADRYHWPIAPPARIASQVAFALLVMAMAARCWVRSAEWRDNGTLYAAAYRDQPNAVGPLQLYGAWLAAHGEYLQGVFLLEQAVAIDPGFTDAHLSLGEAHLAAERWEQAMNHLQVAAMQDADNPRVQPMLHAAKNQLTALRIDQLEAIRRRADERADDSHPQIELIDALRRVGRLGEALERIERFDNHFANDPKWQYSCAVVYVYAGQRDAAIERYRRYLDIASGPEHEAGTSPANQAQASVELAMLLLERREADDVEEAKRWCQHASEFAVDQPMVHACQAEVAVAEGDITGAIRSYRRALDRLPEGSGQRQMFEQRLKSLGGE
jgi:protein O-mannosyl-transferase